MESLIGILLSPNERRIIKEKACASLGTDLRSAHNCFFFFILLSGDDAKRQTHDPDQMKALKA
jgi:hypothetical protein